MRQIFLMKRGATGRGGLGGVGGMLIVVAMSLNAGLASAADPNVGRAKAPHGVQCIDVLGPGGRYELTGDLNCLLVMITIRDGASLDLNGYTLGDPHGDTEILLSGTGTTLKNGDVGPSAHYAIWVGGEGGHTVQDVVAPSGDGTVTVSSNNNRLIDNIISGVNAPVLGVGGTNNKLTGNTIVCGSLFDDCIDIVGMGNTVTDNDISSSLGPPTECLPSPSLALHAGIGIHRDANRVRTSLPGTPLSKTAVLTSLTPLVTVPTIPGETIRL